VAAVPNSTGVVVLVLGLQFPVVILRRKVEACSLCVLVFTTT
jgi:hypothetical protein